MNYNADMVIVTSQFASGVSYLLVSDCTSCRVCAMNKSAYLLVSDCTSCRVCAMNKSAETVILTSKSFATGVPYL